MNTPVCLVNGRQLHDGATRRTNHSEGRSAAAIASQTVVIMFSSFPSCVCPPLSYVGQKLWTLGADEMDPFGKRRHHAVGLSVGAGDARGSQDAKQNVWRGQHRCSVQTSEEEHGVMVHLWKTPGLTSVDCSLWCLPAQSGGSSLASSWNETFCRMFSWEIRLPKYRWLRYSMSRFHCMA